MSYIEMLELIFKLVKRAKKPIVKIFPDGRVIGTDEQFASLNIITDGTGVMINLPCPFIIDVKEITAFMRDIGGDYDSHKVVFDYPFRFVSKSAKSMVANHIEWNYNLDELYNKVITNELSKPVVYMEEDINKSNPEMFSMKVSDGAKMFNIDNRFLMTSFNAIHPSTKSDKVTLVIRDSDIYSYTAEFIINKKKDKYDIHEILRFKKI